jgi:uncharacterized SAM-binding protein YcdF (DUF218 family)
MTIFVLLKYLTLLLLPPASLFIGLLIALALKVLKFRRLALLVAVLSLAEILVLSFPPVSDGMLGALEDRARAAERVSPRCCYKAIVLLGGGIQPAVPPYLPFPSLNPSADRIWLAARLYHEGVAPIIVVSGGNFLAAQGAPATTEAEAMRVFLVALGVPSDAIVSEGRSLNTIENMRFVRAIVHDDRVALVTSAYHMPRALKLARAVGLDAAAFATDYRSIREIRPPWENWVLSVDSLGASAAALREYAALYFDHRATQ